MVWSSVVIVGDTYHKTNRSVLVAAPKITFRRSVAASSWQVIGDDRAGMPLLRRPVEDHNWII
jgi:hypothetical protein